MSIDRGAIFQVGFDTGEAGCRHIGDDPSQLGVEVAILPAEKGEPRVGIAGEGRHCGQRGGSGVQSSRHRGGRKADGANEVAAGQRGVVGHDSIHPSSIRASIATPRFTYMGCGPVLAGAPALN